MDAEAQKARDRKAYLAKMDRLIRALEAHTKSNERLCRMLHAMGVRDTDDLTQAVQSGVVAPSVMSQLVEHFRRAFPPDYLRDAAEDILDDFTRPRRRR